MDKINIQSIKNKICINKKSNVKFSSASILKFGLALALLIIISLVVFAVNVEVNEGILRANNGFMAGLNSAGDFIDYDVSNNTYFKAPGVSNSIFFEVPDGTPRMTILGSSGNVGIGTESPGKKLSVNGDASVPTNSKICLNGDACTKYIYYDGTKVVIQG